MSQPQEPGALPGGTGARRAAGSFGGARLGTSERPSPSPHCGGKGHARGSSPVLMRHRREKSHFHVVCVKQRRVCVFQRNRCAFEVQVSQSGLLYTAVCRSYPDRLHSYRDNAAPLRVRCCVCQGSMCLLRGKWAYRVYSTQRCVDQIQVCPTCLAAGLLPSIPVVCVFLFQGIDVPFEAHVQGVSILYTAVCRSYFTTST